MTETPEHPEHREIVVSFRLTPSEAGHVDAAAEVMRPRRTRTDWCRAAALAAARAKIPAPPPPRRNPSRRLPRADVRALAEVLAALGKLGSNVNQLARTANRAGRLPDEVALKTMAAGIAAAAGDVRRALEGGGDGDQG